MAGVSGLVGRQSNGVIPVITGQQQPPPPSDEQQPLLALKLLDGQFMLQHKSMLLSFSASAINSTRSSMQMMCSTRDRWGVEGGTKTFGGKINSVRVLEIDSSLSEWVAGTWVGCGIRRQQLGHTFSLDNRACRGISSCLIYLLVNCLNYLPKG